MALKFINPFNGTPTKIRLTELFLFHPHTYLDIAGHSISRAFKLMGKESLLKRFDAIKPEDKVSPDRLRSLITEMLDASETPDALRRKFLEDLERAIGEDEKGEFNPASMGMYEAAVVAFNPSGKQLGAPQEFLLEIERESRAAFALMHKRRFEEAAQEILDSKFFAPFLWGGIRDALGRVTDFGTLLILRASIAMEVFLAVMVVYESEYEATTGQGDQSCVLDLWPIVGPKAKNPFGMLFEWTKRESGASTQREFFDHPALREIEMDELRLKRWSSGTHQPRKEWLDRIAAGLWGNAEHPAFQMRLAYAQQVNFLGHFSQLLVALFPKEMTASQSLEAYPWPNYPHDLSDFADWGRTRYPVWREYARDYRAKFE
ncbi:hypothetical protein hmeg3_12990 [Herbaspirillum sp. meg3]|uniref:hypothetical protein n=1 Tax=Herbaspirillum sp. meg3 TaxID=2025949 RepID=UPI000B996305|nr:hypothetical protein [Herbaspirillum sp. meg3]ASU39109.1 hypothetical protein hmeg3_12990 [Herbaspirillum sp. meg3]